MKLARLLFMTLMVLAIVTVNNASALTEEITFLNLKFQQAGLNEVLSALSENGYEVDIFSKPKDINSWSFFEYGDLQEWDHIPKMENVGKGFGYHYWNDRNDQKVVAGHSLRSLDLRFIYELDGKSVNWENLKLAFAEYEIDHNDRLDVFEDLLAKLIQMHGDPDLQYKTPEKKKKDPKQFSIDLSKKAKTAAWYGENGTALALLDIKDVFGSGRSGVFIRYGLLSPGSLMKIIAEARQREEAEAIRAEKDAIKDNSDGL